MYNSGPPRFDGGERRFGDRDGYRGAPRGAGGDFGDKGGAPADYQPSFRVILLLFAKELLLGVLIYIIYYVQLCCLEFLKLKYQSYSLEFLKLKWLRVR